MPAFLVQLAVGVGLQILGYLLAPRPPGEEPPTVEALTDPTAERGRVITVVMGSVTIRSPNNLGFWDKEIRVRDKSGGKK